MPDVDNSKPQANPSVIAEAKTQQYGYIRAYRAVVQDCGVMAAYLYGILEDYAQLGARTGKGCIPSHDHLATLMGCHRNTVITLMKKLRETGWVTWEDTIGGTNVYSLPIRRVHKNGAPPAQDLCTPCTDTVHNQEQESKNKRVSPPPPTVVSPPEGENPVDSRAKRLPKGWTVPESGVTWAEARGWDAQGIAEQTEAFVDHWKAKTERRLDWEASWRNWMRKAEDYRKPSKNGKESGAHGWVGSKPEERRPTVPAWQPEAPKYMSPEKLAAVRAARRGTE